MKCSPNSSFATPNPLLKRMTNTVTHAVTTAKSHAPFFFSVQPVSSILARPSSFTGSFASLTGFERAWLTLSSVFEMLPRMILAMNMSPITSATLYYLISYLPPRMAIMPRGRGASIPQVTPSSPYLLLLSECRSMAAAKNFWSSSLTSPPVLLPSTFFLTAGTLRAMQISEF